MNLNKFRGKRIFIITVTTPLVLILPSKLVLNIIKKYFDAPITHVVYLNIHIFRRNVELILVVLHVKSSLNFDAKIADMCEWFIELHNIGLTIAHARIDLKAAISEAIYENISFCVAGD